MTGRHVPAVALEEREGVPSSAVGAAGVPAVELFGDANVVAAENAAEPATAEEAVRTSLGSGLRPALREVGGTLTGLGTVVVLLTLIRRGWSVDVNTTSALLAASPAVPCMAWAVCRALFSGGRPVATMGVLTAAVAVAGAGIAWAASLNTDHVVARDVPVPLLGLVVIAPGVLALLVASRLPQSTSATTGTTPSGCDASATACAPAWCRRTTGSATSRRSVRPSDGDCDSVRGVRPPAGPGSTASRSRSDRAHAALVGLGPRRHKHAARRRRAHLQRRRLGSPDSATGCDLRARCCRRRAGSLE